MPKPKRWIERLEIKCGDAYAGWLFRELPFEEAIQHVYFSPLVRPDEMRFAFEQQESFVDYLCGRSDHWVGIEQDKDDPTMMHVDILYRKNGDGSGG